MTYRWIAAVVTVAAMGTAGIAQGPRPLSGTGTAATHVLGKWTKPAGRGAPTLGGEAYEGGKWIEVTYGRPLKRGRNIWGSGADYGKSALAGAPVWRAGANVSTRLKTEVPLVINGKTVAPGEYSLFIDLKENNWTFIVSSWGAQTKYDPNNKEALWGSYNYTPAKDVVRAPMKLETLSHAHEELTWEFIDVSDAGGTLALAWDKVIASVAFRIGA